MSKSYKDMHSYLKSLEPFKINTMSGKVNALKTMRKSKLYYEIYSYNTIIAVVIRDKQDTTCYLSTAKYSRTSSRHASYIKQAFINIKNVDIDYFVNVLGYSKSDFMRSCWS